MWANFKTIASIISALPTLIKYFIEFIKIVKRTIDAAKFKKKVDNALNSDDPSDIGNIVRNRL